MGDELKPCPCCNGKAVASSVGAYDYGFRDYTVRCKHCDLSTNEFRSEQESIEAWNTRAESEQIKKLAEALENINEYAMHIPLHFEGNNSHSEQHIDHFVNQIIEWCDKSLAEIKG